MAYYYVANPADGGSDNNNGQSWSYPWASPEKAMQTCAGGDYVFCAHDLDYTILGSSDRYLGDYTNAGPGSQDAPVHFVSVTKGCQMPPQPSDYQAGAKWGSNDTGRTIFICGHTVWQGFHIHHPLFSLNDETSGVPYRVLRDKVLFIDCTLEIKYEAGWNFQDFKMWDCILQYTYGTSYDENVMLFRGVVIRGGELDWQYTAATSSLMDIFTKVVDVYGFDFSDLASGAGIIGPPVPLASEGWNIGGFQLQQRNFSIRGCKLHSGYDWLREDEIWLLYNRTWERQRGFSFEENAVSGLPDPNQQYIRLMGGILEQDWDIYYYGRAVSDQYSWKLTSEAKGCYTYFSAISCPILCTWTDSSSEKTFSIEILHDSVTNLKDDEVWLELRYNDDANPQGKIITDRRTIWGTAADQAAGVGASNWNHNLTNPNSQKVSVTVTPVAGQPIEAVVYLAKADYTIYIDPVLRES